jgi:hypothetical protein
MALLLSVTYLETDSAVEHVFATVADVFHQVVEDKLYAPPLQTGEAWEKCGPMVVERFLGPGRAGFVVDAMSELYFLGVRVYPRRRGLFTLMDSIVTWDGDIFGSSRPRMAELSEQLEHRPQAVEYIHLPTYMRFLSVLSKRLNTDVVHLMAADQAAGSATSIHFYRDGQFVDNYYAEDLQELHERELPQHPGLIRRILKGRFSFLLRLPRRVNFGGEVSEDHFFVHRYFPWRRFNYCTQAMEEEDEFGLRRRGLYIPSWDKRPDPYGAVFCPAHDVPNWLFQEHGVGRPSS